MLVGTDGLFFLCFKLLVYSEQNSVWREERVLCGLLKAWNPSNVSGVTTFFVLSGQPAIVRISGRRKGVLVNTVTVVRFAGAYLEFDCEPWFLPAKQPKFIIVSMITTVQAN